MCCVCVANVLLMCCLCIANVLLMCCLCVASVLLMCCLCVANVFLMCCLCVASVLLMCCLCVANVLLLCWDHWHTFSKVLSTGNSHSQHTKTLTFQNVFLFGPRTGRRLMCASDVCLGVPWCSFWATNWARTRRAVILIMTWTTLC
jgi:hypothetical protein